MKISKDNPVICWWSGGITSAVACKLAINQFGVENCKVIMLDTRNEHKDTYRFLKDCEKWYGLSIELLFTTEYTDIQNTWLKHLSLNTATGAICSYTLKRRVREKWEKENKFSHQVFGFEFNSKEFKRALSLKLNHPKTKPIFPLLQIAMNKEDCIEYVKEAGLEIPEAYKLGFQNNNCLNTGCVQGGIGYWQKMKREYPDKFEKMAQMEHDITDKKGHPVTMLKDQSNKAKKEVKDTGNKYANLVFLKKHKDYPNKCIDDMDGREPKPLTDCNGFCGVDELNEKNQTELEINYEE